MGVLANNVSDKGLAYRMLKKKLQHNSKKMNNLILNWAKE